jgi:hypothetical protein
MKLVFISLYGGGTLYFGLSVEEAKRRYIERHPNRNAWDFTLGLPNGNRVSAVTELDIGDELEIFGDGAVEICQPDAIRKES